MLTALLIVAVQGEETIESKVYEARLAGPVSIYSVLYVPGETAEIALRSHDRMVTVTISDIGMRCDTDGWISVVKTDSSEYFLIDHKMRTVLIYPSKSQEEGLSAVCATTPLWPEAYGDKSSFEAVRSGPEQGSRLIDSSPTKYDDPTSGLNRYLYFGEGAPGGVALKPRYTVVDGQIEGFHNLNWYSSRDRHSWRMEFRGPFMGIFLFRPVAESKEVKKEIFEYPADYDAIVVGSNDGYTGAETADEDQVRQYVADFEIPAVFSVKRVFNLDG